MEELYRQLIERERSFIATLQGKIAHHERRIAMIEELARDEADDQGPLLLAAPPDQPERRLAGGFREAGQAGFRDPKRNISESNVKLLQYIGTVGRSLDDLEAFANEAGLNMERNAIRSFANIYRTRFGFIESPSLGHYRLTPRAVEFLQLREESAGQDSNDEDPAAGL